MAHAEQGDKRFVDECVHRVAGAACFQCFVVARNRGTAAMADAMMEVRPDATVPETSSPIERYRALTPAELQHRRVMLLHLSSFRFGRP